MKARWRITSLVGTLVMIGVLSLYILQTTIQQRAPQAWQPVMIHNHHGHHHHGNNNTRPFSAEEYREDQDVSVNYNAKTISLSHKNDRQRSPMNYTKAKILSEQVNTQNAKEDNTNSEFISKQALVDERKAKFISNQMDIILKNNEKIKSYGFSSSQFTESKIKSFRTPGTNLVEGTNNQNNVPYHHEFSSNKHDLPSSGFSTPPRYVPFLDNLEEVEIVPTIVPNTNICDENTLVLIAVCSSVESLARREAIRDTWGSLTHNSKLGVSIVFILGQPDIQWQHLDKDIVAESMKYNDILQWNFIDHYSNLTLKTFGLLKWTSEYCTGAKFLMKTDDDVFINIPNLLQLLTQSLHNNQSTSVLIGYAIEGAKPGEDRHSKWFTSDTVFRDHFYPRYLSGSAYIISQDQISALYQSALHIPPFWLEDVYITGILTSQTGATLVHNSRFWYRKRKGGPCEYKTAVAGHELSADDLYRLWQELHHPHLDCSGMNSSYRKL